MKALKHVLDKYLKGLYKLKVIDVLEGPQLAEQDKILATPILVKASPSPERRIVGNLSDKDKVLSALGLTAENGAKK